MIINVTYPGSQDVHQYQGFEDIPNYDQVKSIECSNNNLERLVRLPPNIKFLECQNNNLKSLPYLPDSLIYIDCSKNKITHIERFPDKLCGINCENNLLTELPPISRCLSNIYCKGNLIDELPRTDNLDNSRKIIIESDIEDNQNLFFTLLYKLFMGLYSGFF